MFFPPAIRALLQTDDPDNIRLAIALAKGQGLRWDAHWALLRVLEDQGTLPKVSYTLENLLHLLNQVQELSLTQPEEVLRADFLHFLKVKKLTLRHLALTELPDWLPMWSQLEVLHCSHTPLSYLPPSIGEATTLKQLILPHNQLTKLPEELEQLHLLERLDLSHNPLSNLPECFDGLRALREVHLSHLGLTRIPHSLCSLTHLTVLNLSNNRLHYLPDWVANLPDLQVVYLKNNPLTTLPESLLYHSKVELVL